MHREEEYMEQLINGLLNLELANDRIRRSTYNPSPRNQDISLESFFGEPSKMGIDFGDMPGWPLYPEENMFTSMSLEEHIRLRLPFPITNQNRPPNAKLWRFANLVYAIEYVKTFDFYNQLDFLDQMNLLKRVSLFASHLTTAFYSFSHGSDCTYHPAGYRVAYLDPKARHFVIVHKSIIATLIRLQVDRKEYILLKALIICADAIDGLSDSARKVLAREKRRYSNTLFSYILATRGPVKGPTAYAAFIAVVDLVIRVTQFDKDLHMLIFTLGLVPAQSRLMAQIYED